MLSVKGNGNLLPGRWVKVPGPLGKVRAGATDRSHQKETVWDFCKH